MRPVGFNVRTTPPQTTPDVVEKIVYKEKEVLILDHIKHISVLNEVDDCKSRLMDKFLTDLRRFNAALEQRVYDRQRIQSED